MAKVNLTLLDTQLICRGRWYANNGVFTRDGRILFAPEYYEYDAGVDSRKNIYSSDGGHTWSEVDNVLGRFHFIELKDGGLFGVSYLNEVNQKIPRHQTKKPYVMAVRRAENLDALLAGQYEDHFISIDIPELSGNFGDSNNYGCGCADHGIVELPNGDLVVNMYGHFRGDQTKITFFPTESCQYRTWVVVSRDGGRSFSYLSTVADVQTWPIGEKGEGYCEPDLKVLQDGKMLCVMRSGGSPHDGKNGYTDLVCCTSYDGGISWTKPASVLDYGVYPQIVQTENGGIVVAAGRDGVFLTTSADGGQTWSDREIIVDAEGPFGYTPTGYTCIGEVAPNEILVIYDDMDDERPQPLPGSIEGGNASFAAWHNVYARRYHVERID